MNDPKVIVALDFSTEHDAFDMLYRLDPELCKVKIGKELFTIVGPLIVVTATAMGFDVFLDLKFHDIPSTVAGACRAAADLGVWAMNIHASGGMAMMEAAVEAVEDYAVNLLAVTVLTSLNDQDLRRQGIAQTVEERVLWLANMAVTTGCDGIVCSPKEVKRLSDSVRDEHSVRDDFLLVTPGIRPSSVDDDQKRVATPEQAIRDGSNYLVVGRPITQAKDPNDALVKINDTIGTMGD